MRMHPGNPADRHPEDVDAMDEDEDEKARHIPDLPSRGINGAR
jgi:hypothetical protein